MMLCGIMNFSAHATSSLSSNQYDTLVTSTIQFRHGRSTIDSTYLDNTRSLAAIRTALKQAATEPGESIVSIIIEGHASPVGKESYNQSLSMRRAQKAETFLRTVPGFETVHMILVGKGEDWHTFSEDIKSGYHRQNRTEVLAILDQNLSTYKKESQLKALDHGQATWNYLVENHMATSRHAVAIVVVKKRRSLELLPHPDTLTAKAVTMLQSGLLKPDYIKSATAPSAKRTSSSNLLSSARTPVASVRTNLLVPALNIGAELPLGNNWSVAADYYFPWIWPSKKNENCFEFLGWSAEGRYWFGRDRKPQDRLKGHSVGVYFAGGYYDFERSYRGMQGEFISPGLDYTYSMAIGRRKNLHLQFTLAVGYIRSWGRTYNVFGSYGELYPDEGTLVWDYFGPTKAAVSLVVPFYKKEGRK